MNKDTKYQNTKYYIFPNSIICNKINKTKYTNSQNLNTLDCLINERLAKTWDTTGGQDAVKSMNNIYKSLETTMKNIEDLYNNLNSFSLKASYEERTEEKRV